MSLPTLRAEIKAWERDFRAQHARDPSVDEIKAQPAIAAKYKQYKALCKTEGASSSALPPKRAVIKAEAPAVTTNPFSPQKKKPGASQPASRLPALCALPTSASRANPFSTPTKSKTRPTKRSVSPDLLPKAKRKSPSPDPFPLIFPAAAATKPRAASPVANLAVSRARKRLRGEVVSPSPVKEKRARIPFPDSASDDAPERGANSSFVEDTPVKPPLSGKSFKLLFDEAPSGAQKIPRLPLGKAISRSDMLTALKGERSHSVLKARLSTPAADHADRTVSSSQPARKRLTAPVPGRSNLRSEVAPSRNETRSTTTNGSKRPRPEADDVMEAEAASQPSTTAMTPRNTFLDLPLLPPSPPPADSSKDRYNSKGKGRAKPKDKAAYSRKKAKVLEEATAGDDGEEDESDSGDEPPVKVVERTWSRNKSTTTRSSTANEPEIEGDDSDDWLPPPVNIQGVSPDAELETISVNLPDSLRRILAFSPSDAREEMRKEAKVVRGLLYGKRGHYDPERGGEVWGVGEVGEDSDGGRLELRGDEGGSEDEDEWEGEGVPWEGKRSGMAVVAK